MTLSRPGHGAVSFEAAFDGGYERVPGGHPYADRPAAGSAAMVTQVVEVVLVQVIFLLIGVVRVVRSVLRRRVVRVVVDGVCRREEVGEIDAFQVRTKEAEGGEDVGFRVAVERRKDDGGGWERGVRLIGSGRAAGDAGGDVECDGGLAG